MAPDTQTPAAANDSERKQQQGLFIRGTYLGSQGSRSFNRAGTGEEVQVKPKIGLNVDGVEMAVKAKDDRHLDETVRGFVKGDTVTVRVEARPPFGARGDVDFVLPGVIAERREEWR